MSGRSRRRGASDLARRPRGRPALCRPVLAPASLVSENDLSITRLQTFFSMRLEGGPWFVGLDELIRHYSHGPNGLPCQLLEPCPGDPLPPELLASGPGQGAHLAQI